MERGETQGSYTQLDSSTEYSIFAFGYKGQSVTTGLFRKDFTTETDIAKITFSINVDMSWGFHNIHIIPNPITALYYYEIVTEETTVKESLQIIDEIAKQKYRQDGAETVLISLKPMVSKESIGAVIWDASRNSSREYIKSWL